MSRHSSQYPKLATFVFEIVKLRLRGDGMWMGRYEGKTEKGTGSEKMDWKWFSRDWLSLVEV